MRSLTTEQVIAKFRKWDEEQHPRGEGGRFGSGGGGGGAKYDELRQKMKDAHSKWLLSREKGQHGTPESKNATRNATHSSAEFAGHVQDTVGGAKVFAEHAAVRDEARRELETTGSIKPLLRGQQDPYPRY